MKKVASKSNGHLSPNIKFEANLQDTKSLENGVPRR